MTPKRGNWFPRLICCVCHLHYKRAVNSLAAVREFSKTVLQQVYLFKVDVIAGDANAAPYKYFQRQEHQDLHESSFAVMVRETKREVSTGHPSERRLHIDYSTNDHSLELHEATDLDCCFMVSFHGESQPDPESSENSVAISNRIML